MFKLLIFTALCAAVAARPGYLSSPPILYTAPTYIKKPLYASVGSIIKTVPTAVSHQSISQVHPSTHYIQPLVAPVVKATYSAPVFKAIPTSYLHTSYTASPVYKSYAHDVPLLHSYHGDTILKPYAPSYAGLYSYW